MALHRALDDDFIELWMKTFHGAWMKTFQRALDDDFIELWMKTFHGALDDISWSFG